MTEIKERPQAECSECKKVFIGHEEYNQRCTYTYDGKRCEGIICSIADDNDLQECNICEATGNSDGTRCFRCEGLGWLNARDNSL